MRQARHALFAIIAALALAGCGSGASDADLAPQRGIDADISASLYHGPGATMPGMFGSEVQTGAIR
jgi:hypothetical protein